MICPACKYEHKETYSKKENDVIGEFGDFFYFNKPMRRHDYKGRFHTRERADMMGCPRCGNIFMDVEKKAGILGELE